MRKLLEKEILIRLTETGFVETTRFLGVLPIESQDWAVDEAEWLVEQPASDDHSDRL